ncbi:hypothetical protein ACOMHN_017574 [Nucella lapillus]
MAQSATGSGKRRSAIDNLNDPEGAKRLKQGRLPFQPLGHKPLTALNNTTASKKRKLSGHESPNTKAKQPKLPDLKNSCEQGKPGSLNDDNEVSSTSASETEYSSVNCVKTKMGKTNLLEKFVRREDEISSTNEVIDLTESVDENDPSENSPMKVKSPRKSMLKSPWPKPECANKDKPEANFSRKLVFEKEERAKKETETVLEENASPGKEKESEPENESMECVASADDIQGGKDVKEEGGKSDQVDEEAVILNESLNSSSVDVSVSPSKTPQKEGEESSASSETPAGKELLSSGCTPQTPASANTSCSSADGTTPQSSTRTKRVLSKKQEERAAMRQKVKDDKERQKLETKEQKEKERLEKKQKRDEEKAEKERAKKEDKEKKEKERLEKKEQTDKEKQSKLLQKEEGKQKKMEKLNAKMEEKRQKEEEKQKEEEEKVRQAEKRKVVFTSFFMKPKAVTSTKVAKAEDNLFIPFEVKKDMTLAPLIRQHLSEDSKQHLDGILNCQKTADMTYVEELKQGTRKPLRTCRVLRKKIEIEQEVELLVHDSEAVKKVMHAVKLLQFHTDYRPPYYGTWRKTVKGLTPRNPWKKGEDVFDYEVDSDEEWEEEEPGESLSDSNGEEEEGEEEEENEDDGWMVPHGYLSEDEGCQDDEDVSPDVLKARQRAKAMAWETDMQAKKQMMPPLHLGCFWLDRPCLKEQHLTIFRAFETVCIRSSPIETILSYPTMCEAGEKSDTSSSKASPNSRCRKRALPEEAIPDLIRLVHGNSFGIKKLVREFRLYWKHKSHDNNVSLDESRMEDDPKVLNDSAMDTSANLDESLVKTAEATDHEPMQTDSTDKPAEEVSSKEQDCKDKSTEEEVSGKKQDDLNVELGDSCVSKRQLEIKIMAIAVREKRQGRRPCWYVSDSVLKQYKMEDLSLDNSWVYVSGDMTKKSEKKTPNQSLEKKTLTHSAETKTKSKDAGKPAAAVLDADNSKTPHKGKDNVNSDSTPKSRKNKKEGSGKKTPKDQPSIMAFAKKAVAESSEEKTECSENQQGTQHSTTDSTGVSEKPMRW